MSERLKKMKSFLCKIDLFSVTVLYTLNFFFCHSFMTRAIVLRATKHILTNPAVCFFFNIAYYLSTCHHQYARVKSSWAVKKEKFFSNLCACLFSFIDIQDAYATCVSGSVSVCLRVFDPVPVKRQRIFNSVFIESFPVHANFIREQVTGIM